MSYRNTYVKSQISDIQSSSIVVYQPSTLIDPPIYFNNIDSDGSMKNTQGNLLVSLDGSKYEKGQYLVTLQISLNLNEASAGNASFSTMYTSIEFENSNSLPVKDICSPNQEPYWALWCERNFSIPFSNNGTSSKINVYVNFDTTTVGYATYQYQFIKLSSDDALPHPL